MPTFEFAVYNEKVREALKSGESHAGYEDSWGDIHYIEVVAPRESMARSKIDGLYPNRRGFVIDGVRELDEDDI